MKKTQVILFLLMVIFMNGINAQTPWSLISEGEEDLIILNPTTGFSFVNEKVGSHGQKYTLKKSSDGFRSFSSILSNSGQFGCYSLSETFCIDADTIFIIEICQGRSSILKSINGGQTWNSTGFGSFDPYMSMYFLKANFGYYSNYSAGIGDSDLWRNADVVFTTKKYIFKKGGLQSPVKTTIKFINDSTGFIICNDTSNHAVILKTIDFGVSWTEKKVVDNQIFNDIHFTSDQIGYVIGKNGQILKTTDFGENWTVITSNVTNDLNSIDFSSIDEGYIVGNNGLILKTVDGGITWNTENFVSTTDLRYVRTFSNGDVFVHDVDRKLYINRKAQTEILIYPNPVNDILHISLPNLASVLSATISNAQGQKILTTDKSDVDISRLSAGVYFICVETDDELYENKFVKE